MKLPDSSILDTIREKYHLSLILLHGSQVTGQTHIDSDIDIAVLSENRNDTLDLLGLINDLSEVFHSDAIDVTNLNHADPLLLQTVSLKSKLLSGLEKDYYNYQLMAFKRYSNFLPYLEQEKEFVRKELEQYVTT